MRARDLEVPGGAGAEYCLRAGVVGIGPGRGDKADRMVRRFATVPEGAFAWTRDRAGEYHLGRIAGGLRSGRNFQRTHDAEAERQTAEIWLRERGESA